MLNHRQFAPVAYIVGFLLFFIPFFDALMSIWPMRPGVAEWRFAAAGLASNAFMIPSAGAMILVATALIYQHYKTQLWLGLFFWLVALIVVLTSLSFFLDAMQTRNGIKPEMYASFRVAMITAEVKLLLAALAFGFLARACKVERWFKRWMENWLKKRAVRPQRA